MQTIIQGYYSLLFLPLGIALYLLIKFGSDLSVSNKSLIINSGFYIQDNKQRIRVNDLIKAVKKVKEKNDSIYIIKGLPIRFDEIDSISFNLDANLYFMMLLESKNILRLHNNMLNFKCEESCYKSFAARMAYDGLIEHGKFCVNRSDNHCKLLDKNNIIASRDLGREQLNWFDKYGKINLVNFNFMQNKVLENKKHIFAPGNSLLLLYFLEDLIKVINC